ncbi:MAG: tripartite tricarboxylate transporter substrate binding protein [Betaproteobacteria bacterium]|nr:tripartite tricarboxylate transporter substrate binding protein [Betaproteobacteria bacterium]
MQRTLKTAFVITLAASSPLHLAPAVAADAAKNYPERPIRFVLAQTSGSSIDTMSRVVATRLSELLGQQLVVDNRPGAGGIIGGEIVAHAAPDGYTLFAGATASQVIGPRVYKKVLKYNPQTDFTPISLFAATQNVLVVNPGMPYRSVKELIAYAKANPGKVNWANAGVGFQSHLAGALLTHMAGIKVLHVPYKGAGPMVAGVIAGEAHVTIGPAPAWMVHVQAGRARALAMGGEKRSTLWPDIPTIIESGVPGYVSDGWAGLMGPKGLPKAIQDKLRNLLVKAVNEPATNNALKRVGAEPITSTPAEFTQRIAKDWTRMGEAIRVAGLKVE